MLTESEKGILLEVARGAIAATLNNTKAKEHAELTQRLRSPSGAFVTLHLDGELRGCIGYIESRAPLVEVVAEVAVKAAFEDPRFDPLTTKEFKKVGIEVSVLSPLLQMESVDESVIGVHGLLIELKGRRGLLLPQVATEHHLGRTEFLEATARKAGLPASAWRDEGTSIHLFTAEVMNESEVHA
jgi:AmmeMemoRadiSam system protein A